MQLDDKRVVQLFKYFEKINGTRCSDWVVEMRRRLSLQMREIGIRPTRIAKVLHVDHSTVSFYVRMVPRPDIQSVIEENMWSWIDDGVYPMAAYEGKSNEYKLRLTQNPYEKFKHTTTARKEKPKKEPTLDELIDRL